MASKLGIYNDALLNLGSERLASLTEPSASRRALDDGWDGNLSFCLEQGYWNFALRAVQIDASDSVVPTFGYQNAFAKPTDYIRMYRLSVYDTFEPPLLDIVDEPNYWFANCDPLYVKYVSDDTAYGRDLSIWPETFAEFVSTRLANKVCKRITGKEPSDAMMRQEKKTLIDARGKDAMNEPPGFPPQGTWVRARRGLFATRTRRDETYG